LGSRRGKKLRESRARGGVCGGWGGGVSPVPTEFMGGSPRCSLTSHESRVLASAGFFLFELLLLL